MRIATWNINGLRSRMDFLLHWLKAREPDVVGLQELKVEDEKFPFLELEAQGYQAVVHGQKAWNGVAILSREPARLLQSGLPGAEERGARLITAQVMGVDFTTIYVPNGKSVDHEDFAAKLEWLDALIDYFQGQRDLQRPVVLGGDFNVCPTSLDTWNEAGFAGRIFHTDAERLRFSRLVELGFVDLFRQAHPQESLFSWWDYRGGSFHRNHGLRIDFLLGSPSVAARLKSVEIDREYRKKQDGLTASDHAPVIADLD